MESNYLLRGIFIILMVLGCHTITSTPPVWSGSSFFKAGKVQFISTKPAGSVENLTITYSSAIVNTDLKVPIMGIADLGYLIPSNEIQLYIKVNGYGTTYIRCQINANTNAYMETVWLSYLAIDNSFTPAISMNYFIPHINTNSSTGWTKQYNVNFTASTGVTLNTAHQNVLLPFLHYVYLRTYDGTIDLNLDFILKNGSYYQVTYTTTSSLWVKYAGFSRIIFDKTAIEALGNDYFHYGIVLGTNTNTASLATNIPPDIIPENLHYGMHSFNIQSGLSQLNYSSAYTITSGNIGLTPLGTYSFSQMRWSYMHHKTRNCPASHPYYNISQLLCYDQCAIGWYGDLSTMNCLQCLYDCYTCTGATSCATCNSTTMHRTLSFSRCAAEPGYYDDGTNNPIAQPCTSPCATCVTTPTFCLTCITGYYISGSACLACSLAITNCSQCTNSSYCTVCNDGSNGTTCTSCSSTQYYEASNTSCVQCSTVITHCSSCTASNTCTLCQSTFTLNSPTSCSCNSSQYLLSGSSCALCSTAISNCLSCSDATTCTACTTSFTLISPTNCACSSTTFLNTTTNLCEPCTQVTPFCSSCTSTTCSTCLSNFTLSATNTCVCPTGYYSNSTSNTCQSCTIITNCITCTDVNTCTACGTGYKVNKTDNQCIVQPCTVTNCDTCVANTTTICQSCYSGFSVQTAGSSCLSFCGNNAIDTSEVCDDGNTISGDGCSSSCQSESGFTCTDQIINSTNTYSWCFYTSTISFTNVWIRKFQGNNSLKFQFQINNQIDQWTSVDFQSILFINQVDSANMTTGMIGQMISQQVVGYKADKNRFWVIVDYVTYNMEAERLSFELTPYAHNTYPSFTPPNNVEFVPSTIRQIVTVIANNNQNSNLYSEYQYGLYSISVVTTYIITGLAIIAVLTSLVFRVGKIITFQMLTIMQITYFSLASLDSFNPIFSGLLPLRFLAGILNFRGIEEYLEETSSPNAMKGIYMFLNISNNFSLVAAGFGCFIGLGLLLLGIYALYDYCANPKTLEMQSKKPHERKGYFLYRLAFNFIGQVGLTIVFFCVPLYTISVFFEVLFTMEDSDAISYLQGGGVGIAIAVYFTILLKSDPPKRAEDMSKVGEYLTEFSKIGCFQKFKFPNYLLMEILLISGLTMAAIYSNSKIFSAMCIVSAAVVDIVIVAVIKPYRYGFVSCCKGEENESELFFQKIELFKIYDKEQPTVIRIQHPQITEKSDQSQNENNSQVFAQHFATKKNEIKTKHQGLVQGGQILNQTKLFLFNNNTRRIFDMVTLIVVQFIFICAKIYEDTITLSYPGPTIQNLLPLIIHIILFLNVVYNYFMLVLQIMDRRKEASAKVQNQPDSSEQFNKSLYTSQSQSPLKAVMKNTNSSMITANVPTNRLIVKNTSGASKSFYDLKRPQIVRPQRIRRKHKRNQTVINEANN